MRFFITSSLVVLLMVACTEEKNPVMDLSPPAGKQVAASQQELVIAWDCGASTLWTIFYKNHRFLLGTSSTPLVTEYLDSGKRKRYEAASVWDAQGDRASAVWMQANGKCVLRSNRITEADVVRIYAAEVNRDALGRYYLQQDGESFLINRRYVNSDGELTPPIDVFWHRDFADLQNRDDPRPDGLTRIGDQRAHLYYLPRNIDLEALEALGEMPKDDRELLLPTFAEGYSAFLEYEDSSLEQDGRTDTNDELTALESVASDSLYCRDADLWTEYCTTFGNLPNGGCDAIANCGGALLGASSVMAIVSDTAWVQFNPADYGWIRFPLSTSGSGRDVSFQRWVHPKYSGWGDASLYGDPAPPELIGLVKYPYRPLGGMKVTLYGFPCEGKNCAWGTSSSSSPVIASPVDSEPTDKVVVGGVDEGVENTGQVEGGESKPPVANTPPAAGVSTATSPGNPTPVSSTAAEGAQDPPSTDPPVVQDPPSTDPPVVQSPPSTDPPVVQGSSSSTDPPVVQGSSSSTDPPVVQGSSSSTDPPVVQEQEEVSGRGGGSEKQERYGPANPEAYMQYFRNSPPVPCTGNTPRFSDGRSLSVGGGKLRDTAFNTEVREKQLFYHGVELDEDGNPELDENGDPIKSQMCVPCCEFPNSYTDYLEGTRDEFIAEMNRRFPVPQTREGDTTTKFQVDEETGELGLVEVPIVYPVDPNSVPCTWTYEDPSPCCTQVKRVHVPSLYPRGGFPSVEVWRQGDTGPELYKSFDDVNGPKSGYGYRYVSNFEPYTGSTAGLSKVIGNCSDPNTYCGPRFRAYGKPSVPYSGINPCKGEAYPSGRYSSWNNAYLCNGTRSPAAGGDDFRICDQKGTTDPTDDEWVPARTGN